MAMRLSCPSCKHAIAWSDEYPFRPFCSERCRLIDLGAWLSEQHAIPGKETEFEEDGAPSREAPPEE
jgi:endogenous inhibitor of DNA gyrase (YacG/DUF329 family)